MNDYTFTTKVTFKSLDDIEARDKIEKMRENSVNDLFGDVEEKLQCIYTNKPPRKVKII